MLQKVRISHYRPPAHRNLCSICAYLDEEFATIDDCFFPEDPSYLAVGRIAYYPVPGWEQAASSVIEKLTRLGLTAKLTDTASSRQPGRRILFRILSNNASPSHYAPSMRLHDGWADILKTLLGLSMLENHPAPVERVLSRLDRIQINDEGDIAIVRGFHGEMRLPPGSAMVIDKYFERMREIATWAHRSGYQSVFIA